MNFSYEFTDDYDHLDANIEYTLENVLSENVLKNIDSCEESKQLHELFNTVLLNKCKCKEGDQQCSNCSHGGNYVLNKEFQELVLCSDSQHSNDIIFECSDTCSCKIEKCQNRLVQFGPRKFLKIIDSPQYGSKGLITTSDIPKGAFVCEYAGELVTKQEARNITRKNEVDHRMNYVLYLKELCKSEATDSTILVTTINPSRKGNIGRYLNHSCDPNCQIISVHIDCPIPKIAFFSKRYIKANEEICFNYNEGAKENEMNITAHNRIPCLCRTKNCMKYLPNSE